MTRATRFTTAIVLLAAVALTIVPLISIFFASVQEPGTPVTGLAWPETPHWENFATAWSVGGFAKLFLSSSVVVIGVVPLGLILATLGGYALSRYRFRGSSVVVAVLLLGLTLPLESIVLPLYYGLRAAGLLDSYWALILPLIGVFMPFGIFWMRSHFDSLPTELTEAAEMDGAGAFTVFVRILLPTAKPALATLALLYFMWAWNQFLLALVLIQDPSRRTAPAGLGQFVTQYGKDIPLLSASTIIVVIPVVIVYAIFQRQLVRGFLQGAVR